MTEFKSFWLSWYCPGYLMGMFELHSPWWISGSTMDGAWTICAAVRAANEDAAKAVILASYDDPPDTLKWRFVEEQRQEWSPFCDRFTRADWMQWHAEDTQP